MNKKIFHLTAVVFCFACLNACSAGKRSQFVSPQVAIPDNWQQNSHLTTPSVHLDKWWTLFNDPQLNQLVSQALQTNNDLALATLTLHRARLEAGLAENDQQPVLSSSSAISSQFTSGDTDHSISSYFSLSYELDLWNRLAALNDATQWAAQASAADRESTAHSLVVNVTTLYWKMAYLSQRMSLSADNITGIEHIVSLTKRQYDNGSATRLAVLEATQSLYKQQIIYGQLAQQLSGSQHALSILLNLPPQDVLVNIKTLPQGPLPEIAVGIPADLLLRRPDIKSSLATLQSVLASKDAVAASYLPTLSLTGSAGFSSTSLFELLQNPVATLGAGLTLPFLQWNKMKLKKNISDIEYQTAVINYRTTLYEAFSEVANYLVAREQYQLQGEKLHAQYSNTQAVEKIYASQYHAGAITMLDWINAMETRRDAQASLLENQYNQLITQAKLYQSLGGADIAPGMASSPR